MMMKNTKSQVNTLVRTVHLSQMKRNTLWTLMQYDCDANSDKQSYYECEICKGCFSKIFSLNEHLTIVNDLHMPKSMIKCDKRFTILYYVQCKKKFPTAGKSNHHMYTRHGNIRCSQCDKRFSTMNKMKKPSSIETCRGRAYRFSMSHLWERIFQRHNAERSY